MAKKKEVATNTEEQEISQKITNYCIMIGDKSFLIRQSKAEIIRLYAEIDVERAKLQAVKANGPQVTK